MILGLVSSSDVKSYAFWNSFGGNFDDYGQSSSIFYVKASALYFDTFVIMDLVPSKQCK